MRTCFVVMGYGTRTDPDTSRKYDLDKSYRSVIRVAVEKAGFSVVRADEVTESGHISRQMYQSLMDADLVVCDLTTLNPNALFELGVRMAFRPKATIVIAAEDTRIPFNLNQQRFFRYKHGGGVIDYDDALAAQEKLAEVCRATLEDTQPDSLIYAVLHAELEPPHWRAGTAAALQGVRGSSQAPPRSASYGDTRVFVDGAKREERWTDVIERLGELHRDADALQRPIEPWLTQQWALATYKQNEKDGVGPIDDLLRAREILKRLEPARSTDAETLGLWAAIHKRLSDKLERGPAKQRADLAEAIASYRRGWILREDHYNGANYAFLLVRRAIEHPPENERKAVRDLVEAHDAFARVLELCEGKLDVPPPASATLAVEQEEQLQEEFWQIASFALAALALADARYTLARSRLGALQRILGQAWMTETTDAQEAVLRAYLSHPRHRHLSSLSLSATETSS